jgi:flagellar biosynthesis protein FlhF
LDLTEAADRADRALLRRAVFGGEDGEPATAAPQPVVIRPGERRIVALVGPTGAGKTTTTAKLAAHLHLQQGWRVGVITADTFRVGGADQLGAYARILGVPLEVASTPGSLGRAVGRLADQDCILVDTSGRAHRDGKRMQELAALLTALREAAGAPGLALEVHLVLGAATRPVEVRAILEAYRPWVDRMLLTKLDECEGPPDAHTMAAQAGLPLSYAAAGQRVPEDLFVAWPDELLRALPVPAAGRAV